MSKAFTKEDDIAPEPLPRPRLTGSRLITPEGQKALLEELARHEPGSPRAQALALVLDGLQVVEPGAHDGVVRFGSTVRVEDEDGAARTVRIVGPDEAHPPDRISVDSPLARALLGRSRGESVVFEPPKGPVGLEILDVEP